MQFLNMCLLGTSSDWQRWITYGPGLRCKVDCEFKMFLFHFLKEL